MKNELSQPSYKPETGTLFSKLEKEAELSFLDSTKLEDMNVKMMAQYHSFNLSNDGTMVKPADLDAEVAGYKSNSIFNNLPAN